MTTDGSQQNGLYTQCIYVMIHCIMVALPPYTMKLEAIFLNTTGNDVFTVNNAI